MGDKKREIFLFQNPFLLFFPFSFFKEFSISKNTFQIYFFLLFERTGEKKGKYFSFNIPFFFSSEMEKIFPHGVQRLTPPCDPSFSTQNKLTLSLL
jgi:hypothetical protein